MRSADGNVTSGQIVATICPHPIPCPILMSTADSIVRARIDTDTKEQAAAVLAAMGLNVSDAIRLLMLRIVDERRLPFEVKVPNATTAKAIAELEKGKGKRLGSARALFKDLGI